MITSELPDELRGRITAMLERIEQYKGLILCTDRDLEDRAVDESDFFVTRLDLRTENDALYESVIKRQHYRRNAELQIMREFAPQWLKQEQEDLYHAEKALESLLAAIQEIEEPRIPSVSEFRNQTVKEPES